MTMSNNTNTEAIEFTPTEFMCARCNRQHTSLQALRIHEARHRRDDETHKEPIKAYPYPCPWCEQSFNVGRALSQHCTKVHVKTPIELYDARFVDTRKICVDCATGVNLIDQDKGYPERCAVCSRKHIYATKYHKAWT